MRKRSLIAGIITAGILALSHHFWLNEFQFEIFTIILVLSYLLSYKLVDYVADFKTVKEKSRIEIIFLAVFFVILFIPMSFISKNDFSKSENRSLAKYKPLIVKNKINYNFGKDFDQFYNDRFFARKEIVRVYSLLKYYIAINYFENQKGFVNKKNHWMSNFDDFYSEKDRELSQKDKDKIVYNLNKLKKFCDNNNIKFYIITVPRKSEITQKELYPFLSDKSQFNSTRKVIDYVKYKTNIEIIYPYKELQQLQKDSFAYFKSDHHWTDEGAYLGYLKLMEQIKKDFPNIKISQPEDFNYKYSKKVKVNPKSGYFNGITYRNLNLQDKRLLDVEYKYFIHKTFDVFKYRHDNHYKEAYHIYSFENDINAPNLVLFGDSFSLNLLPILPSSFKNSTNIYTYHSKGANIKKVFSIKRFEKYILNNNPQVLVITFCDINRLKYLFKENE